MTVLRANLQLNPVQLFSVASGQSSRKAMAIARASLRFIPGESGRLPTLPNGKPYPGEIHTLTYELSSMNISL